MNNDNSEKNFEEFRKFVLRDYSLQNELRNVTDAEDFVVRVLQEGALRGFEFSADEVKEAMRQMRQAWIERWI